jgi:hypothetical protein
VTVGIVTVTPATGIIATVTPATGIITTVTPATGIITTVTPATATVRGAPTATPDVDLGVINLNGRVTGVLRLRKSLRRNRRR